MLPVTDGALPNPIYRREFFDAIMGEAPGSLLDVGCGDGAFVMAAAERGCRVQGIDADADAVLKLRDAGIAAETGRAEALPFADASFDVVAFSYTTHHLADLPRALAEALRVARRRVMILDAWYDASVPSQRVAEAFDLWSKAIDRRLGMVHNAVPSAAEIMAHIADRGDVLAADYAHRLILAPWPLHEARKAAEAQLAALGDPEPEVTAALARILDEAARAGISRDGALMMRIMKGAPGHGTARSQETHR